jgi:hypothetical protein
MVFGSAEKAKGEGAEGGAFCDCGHDFVYPPYSGSSIVEGFFERAVKLEFCIVMSGNPKGLE